MAIITQNTTDAAAVTSLTPGSRYVWRVGMRQADGNLSYSDWSDPFTAASPVGGVQAGSDLDVGTGKILYSNVYPTLADLPDAASYHGMFAHVHAEGAAYYSHNGNWVRLADNADIPTTFVSGLNGLTGSVILAGGSNVQIGQSGNQLTISSTQTFTTLNGESGILSLVGSSGVSVSTVDGTITVSGAGLASESFVNQAVAGLVNSAPQTLDTLAELANALNNDSDFAANVTTLIAQKADANHDHVRANITDLTTGDLDMQGNRVLFANYYATQADFPDPTVYHGMVAHSHADGAFYGAHAGAWVRLANQSEIPAATSVNTLTGNVTLVAGDNINVTTSGQNIAISSSAAGVQWSSPPQKSASPGVAGDIAYDENYLYIKTGSAWKRVALSFFGYSIEYSQQPLSLVVADGDSATFTVSAATDTGQPVGYLWQKSPDGSQGSWVTIPGEISSTLTFDVTLEDNGNHYRAGANASGILGTRYSESASLIVTETNRVNTEDGLDIAAENGDRIGYDALPEISFASQPANALASLAGVASFSVLAQTNYGGAISYQWQKLEGQSYIDIAGANSATLTLTGLTSQNAGEQYRAVASTPEAGSVTSDPATLSVESFSLAATLDPVSDLGSAQALYGFHLDCNDDGSVFAASYSSNYVSDGSWTGFLVGGNFSTAELPLVGVDGSGLKIFALETRAGELRVFESQSLNDARPTAYTAQLTGLGSGLGRHAMKVSSSGRFIVAVNGGFRVYDYANGVFTQVGNDIPSSATNWHPQDNPVAISPSGSFVAVPNGSNGCEVFELSGTSWVGRGSAIANPPVSYGSGFPPVAINSNGTLLLQGSKVYEFSNGAWAETGSFTVGEQYADGVGMSDDGNVLVVGSLAGTDIYARNGAQWMQTATFAQGGFSVAVSSDGRKIYSSDPLYGPPNEYEAGYRDGRIYVFEAS